MGWQWELRVRCGEDPSSQPSPHCRAPCSFCSPQTCLLTILQTPLHSLLPHPKPLCSHCSFCLEYPSLCLRLFSSNTQLKGCPSIKPSQALTFLARGVRSLSPPAASTASPRTVLQCPAPGRRPRWEASLREGNSLKSGRSFCKQRKRGKRRKVVVVVVGWLIIIINY